MSAAGERFEYAGDPALRERIEAALHRVVDPELALDIVDLGLVYAVRAEGSAVDVRATMTSAACPVGELILEDIDTELRRELGEGVEVRVELVWEPPWSPERMSERARNLMEWD